MRLSHTQREPLELKPLDPDRVPYMWDMLQGDLLAFDDYTSLTREEFELFVLAPNVLSWEIGDGVGLTSVVLDGVNGWIQMVMFDWKYRDYIIDNVIQQAFRKGARRITSSVTEDRHKARKLVERMGLKPEGCMRKAFKREGKYLDVDIYGALEEEYKWQLLQRL